MNKQPNSNILVISGSALAFIGFFVPYVSFSITGFSMSITAAKIAEARGYLYLIPACFLITILICIFKNSYPKNLKESIVGESITAVIGVLCTLVLIIITFSDPSGFVSNANELIGILKQFLIGVDLPTIQTTPGIGLFILLSGFILLGIGIVGEWKLIQMGSGQHILPVNENLPNYYDSSQQMNERRNERAYDNKKPYIPPATVPVNTHSHLKKKKLSAWLVSKDGRNYQLSIGETYIGRTSENDVQLADPKISKRHAKILESNGHFKLIDLGSTNGTWLNGNLVRQPVVLQSEDIIRFGDSFKVQFVSYKKDVL